MLVVAAAESESVAELSPRTPVGVAERRIRPLQRLCRRSPHLWLKGVSRLGHVFAHLRDAKSPAWGRTFVLGDTSQPDAAGQSLDADAERDGRDERAVRGLRGAASESRYRSPRPTHLGSGGSAPQGRQQRVRGRQRARWKRLDATGDRRQTSRWSPLLQVDVDVRRSCPTNSPALDGTN